MTLEGKEGCNEVSNTESIVVSVPVSIQVTTSIIPDGTFPIMPSSVSISKSKPKPKPEPNPEKVISAKDALSHHFYKTVPSTRTGHVGWLECDYCIKDLHWFINSITGNRVKLSADHKLVEVPKDIAKNTIRQIREEKGMISTNKKVKE
jgi:hypothetical protein